MHGWTYSLEKWRVFDELLSKEGFKVRFLKIPGLTSKSDLVWDVDKYLGWLENQIASEKEKIILLGHSNGGRIATLYSIKRPDKIKKLILIDSAGIYHNEPFLKIKRYLFNVIAKFGKKITDSNFMRKLLYKIAGEKDYMDASDNMKKTMANMIKIDLTPMLKDMKVPTLLVWGRADKLTPVSDAHMFNKMIKNSSLRIIEGARHSPFYTHPQKVVDIIKNDF